MDKDQAEKLAKSNWGVNAFALVEKGINKCWVGEYNGPLRQYYGRGKTWEEAFLNAQLQLN